MAFHFNKFNIFTNLQNCPNPGKDNGWAGLLEALKKAKQTFLVEKMTNRCSALFDRHAKRSRKAIKLHCENVRETWQDFLLFTDLNEIFQPLEVIETNGTRVKNIAITNYDYLMDENKCVYLIEGDPGVGKTTYVNKLALEWADGSNDFLCNLFDVVLLVHLYNTSTAEINSKLSQCFEWTIASHDVLIILDGYDENPADFVMKFMQNAKSCGGGKLKIILTTRGTHVDQIWVRDMWLRILGFSTESIQQFLLKQLNTVAISYKLSDAWDLGIWQTDKICGRLFINLKVQFAPELAKRAKYESTIYHPKCLKSGFRKRKMQECKNTLAELINMSRFSRLFLSKEQLT